MLKPKNIDFLFVIEHEDRERGPVKRLCEKLSVRGYKSVILSIEFHSHLFWQFKPKVVAVPYGFSADIWPLNYLIYLYRGSVSWVNLNWEQLLTPINQHFKKPRDPFIRESMYHLAWDSSFFNFLAANGVERKNITVLGNLSHEILQEIAAKPRKIKRKLANKYNLELEKSWVFLPMNYAWAFISDASINSKIQNGYDAENAWAYRDYAQKCLVRFFPFLIGLANKYSAYQIIVRPHPSISVQRYLQALAKQGLDLPDNVWFSKSESIREWIVSSDVVGSSWSSSVWDAVNAGKKGFLFTPYTKPDWHRVWWEESVLNVEHASALDLSSLNDHRLDALPTGISERTADWLIKSMDNKKRFDPNYYRVGFLVRVFRFLRSFCRAFQMKFLNGLGLEPGLRRDYFEPDSF